MSAGGRHVSGCIGYPPEITSRQNVLLAGHDPLAIDYHANKHILFPLGGASAEAHDADNNPRLVSVYKEAEETINRAGGIRGRRVQTGENNIQVIAAGAMDSAAARAWSRYS